MEQHLSGQEISNFLASRRSTRDFLPTPIPQELLEQVLTDALTAPSWSNTRPFMIAVAEGEVKERISAEFQKRWAYLSKQLKSGIIGKIRLLITRYGLPTSNRIISKPYSKDLQPRAMRLGADLYGHYGIKREDREARDNWWAANYKFFGAPTELFVYVHKSLGIYAANDAGLMMENLILSAHGHGLGTCPQGAVGIWDDVVRKEFDIPKNYRLLCGVAIGYPSSSNANAFKANRIAPSEIKAKLKED
ncbi:MAG: nitroreductase [Candidatus Nanopelagicaceae bacterium]|nr:nitroreductase [Candidatus Nanopelagicaceae bacterium]